MPSYVDYIETCDANEVNEMKRKGWVVISEGKTRDPHILEQHYFVLGKPSEKRIEELQYLLKLFIDRGFEEDLFVKIAEENEEDPIVVLSDNEGWNYAKDTSKTQEFINHYNNLKYSE